jgi:hypothetical protein
MSHISVELPDVVEDKLKHVYVKAFCEDTIASGALFMTGFNFEVTNDIRHRFSPHCFLSGLSPLGTAATTGLLYQPQMIDEGDCGAVGGMRLGRGNRSTRRKSASVNLSTTNTTSPEPGSKLGRRGGKPATNRHSHHTLKYYFISECT